MKRKKVVKLMAVVALIGAVGVGGSLALLTATSNSVTNTFAVGDGYVGGDQAVYIDETKVTDNVPSPTAERTKTGNKYTNIQEGDKLTKDPMVHISEGSVESYVFVKITGLDTLKDAGVAVNWDTTHWVKVDQEETSANTVYFYSDDGENPVIVNPKDEEWDSEPLFTKLDFDNADLFEDTGKITLDNIVVKACAVQATTTEDGVKTTVNFNDALELVDFGE